MGNPLKNFMLKDIDYVMKWKLTIKSSVLMKHTSSSEFQSVGVRQITSSEEELFMIKVFSLINNFHCLKIITFH